MRTRLRELGGMPCEHPLATQRLRREGQRRGLSGADPAFRRFGNRAGYRRPYRDASAPERRALTTAEANRPVSSAQWRASAPERRGMVGFGKAPGGLTVVVASVRAGADPQRACRIAAVYIGIQAIRGSTETMRFGLGNRPPSKARSARKR